jgi:NAD(P)-dependent dehydrogenase (short-subunit alcohol dehydrogenase family)
VITGASRGISRATARLFAERGASVVLAARSEGALLEAAAECEAMSARALAVLTDVADWEAVEELARRSVERFGRIDVWVNNALLAAVGRLEDVPPVANLLGYMHGARAALPRFREQDSGVLINMSSGFGLVGAVRGRLHCHQVCPARTRPGASGRAARERGPCLHHHARRGGHAGLPPRGQLLWSSCRAEGVPRQFREDRPGSRVVRREAAPRSGRGQLRQNVEAHAHSSTARSTTRGGVGDRAGVFLRQEREEPSPGNLFAPSSEWTGTNGGTTRRRGEGQAARCDASLAPGRASSAWGSWLGLGFAQ